MILSIGIVLVMAVEAYSEFNPSIFTWIIAILLLIATILVPK